MGEVLNGKQAALGTPLAESQPSPQAFIAKWSPGGKAYRLGERAGAQPHFLELCHLLGVETPEDPENYCFERGFTKATKNRGFADVWKRGHFAWEYKAPHGDLNAALEQLIQYALSLENPPLLVVSDRLQIRIHTHFTGYPSQVTTIRLDDLRDPQVLDKIRAIFVDPYRFKPSLTNREITEDAANAFASIADRLRDRHVQPLQVAHFLTQCVFCFFAEGSGLLRDQVFKRLLSKNSSPSTLRSKLASFFSVMQRGGSFGTDDIDWFNGGLFNEVDVPELDEADVVALRNAVDFNWTAIDPTIFGTLLQRGFDPSMRSQLGGFYTDPATIFRLVEPAVKRPLLSEWRRVKARVAELLESREQLRGTAWTEAQRTAQQQFAEFIERLRTFTVLDPACGSGNFLYTALKCIKDVEHLARIEVGQLGLEAGEMVTGPSNVLGLEINPYAAELARLTVWIGDLQWKVEHRYGLEKRPVLTSLDQIENRDALLSGSSEASWPHASVIVGNPPFLGDKLMRSELGDEYTSRLRSVYRGRVPGGADLVCYWFAKALRAVEGGVGAAAFVGTNSIRGGRNRRVLDAIVKTSRIFEAWSNEPWVNEGAAVRVSLIAFGRSEQEAMLNGRAVDRIYADLGAADAESGELDVAQATTINPSGVSFIGTQKGGPFDVPGKLARKWVLLPNASGRPNSEVLFPWVNGLDLVRRSNDMWIVDFGNMTRSQAVMYEQPWKHCEENVKAARAGNREKRADQHWWQLQRARPEFKNAVRLLDRYIATARVAKYRLFCWQPSSVVPDSQVVAFARGDDCTFGILQSRFHELWSLRLGTSLEDRPRYTPTSCFETFPFPKGLSPAETSHQRTVTTASGARIPADLSPRQAALATKVAVAAQALDAARSRWLNPPEWADRVEPPAGQKWPARFNAKAGFEAALAQRSLTNLYNERPAWLTELHQSLDEAVAAAYGWSDYEAAMADDEVLGRLLVLNKLPQGRTLL